MTLTAWVNQFVDFAETNGFLLDVLTGAVLLVCVSAVLGFTLSVITAAFTRMR